MDSQKKRTDPEMAKAIEECREMVRTLVDINEEEVKFELSKYKTEQECALEWTKGFNHAQDELEEKVQILETSIQKLKNIRRDVAKSAPASVDDDALVRKTKRLL